jgi:hypothetical protein
MKLLEEVEVKLEHLDLANRQVLRRPARQPERLAGIHLSGVLKYVINTSRMPGYLLYAKECEAPAEYPLIWFFGVAWEEACVSLYPDCIWQPGAVVLDGVSMTCDGLSILPEGLAVEEFKYTSCKRKSAADFQQDWLKMQQGRGYCAGYSANLCRWHVLWNNQPWNPVYVRYLFEVTDKDVEDTRRMIVNNRDAAIQAGYAEG